jgi:hypothetical protein
MLQQLFSGVDARIVQRNKGGSIVKGFWRSSEKIVLIPDSDPDSIAGRDFGFWGAKCCWITPYGSHDIQVMASVLGGNCRAGLYIPDSVLDGSKGMRSIRQEVSHIYDGKEATIERRLAGDTLFDWAFHTAPFSAEWLLLSGKDSEAFYILQNHISWLVLHLWEGLMRLLSSSIGDGMPIIGPYYIPSDVAERIGLTIIDRFEMADDKVTLVACLDSRIGLSKEVKEALLEAVPGCRVMDNEST